MKTRAWIGVLTVSIVVGCGLLALAAASTIRFVDGAAVQVEEYRMGDLVLPINQVWVGVIDPDPAPPLWVRLEVPATGDFIERHALIAAAPPFAPAFTFQSQNPVPLIPATLLPNTADLQLEVNPGDIIVARYVDPTNPNDTSQALAQAIIGPVTLYEGAAVPANLRGAFLAIEDDATGTGALVEARAGGVIAPVIEVDEDYDANDDDAGIPWPLILDIPWLTLRATGVPAWTVLESAIGLAVVQIEAHWVTVEGFTMRSGAPGADHVVRIPGAESFTEILGNVIEPAGGFHGVWFGAPADGPWIGGNEFFVTGNAGGSSAVYFEDDADWVVITDNTIEYVAPGTAPAPDFAIYFDSSVGGVAITAIEAYIADNTITDARGAIVFGGLALGDRVVADGSIIEGNTVIDGQYGIFIHGSFDDVVIEGNALAGCTIHGIQLAEAPGVTPAAPANVVEDLAIAGNDIRWCTQYGINLWASEGITGFVIEDNNLEDNGAGALVLVGNGATSVPLQDLTVRDNVFNDNGGPGVAPNLRFGLGIEAFSAPAPPPLLTIAGVVVDNNAFLDNVIGLDLDSFAAGAAGAWAAPPAVAGQLTDVDVFYNLFDGNETGVRVANPANFIQYNDFLGNALYAIDAREIGATPPLGHGLPLGVKVHATSNWWGDITGPTHPSNPGGLGDTVSDHVLYTGWSPGSQLANTITVGSPTFPAGQTSSVTISVSYDQLHGFQVGPVGVVTFSDNTVASVTDVQGIFPYTVTAFDVDPVTGDVHFAANLLPGEAPAVGPVLNLVVDGIGADGDTTLVDITFVDVFRDGGGVDMPYSVIPGQITLSGGGPGGLNGDTNGDGAVDITDARLAAEHAIGIIDLTIPNPPTWSAGAFGRADVAPPLGVVDITDARWIAEAAIGLRTLSIRRPAIFQGALATASVELNAFGDLLIGGSTTDLSDVQGTLFYDPDEITITGVSGVNGFQVLAYAIDDVAGWIKFAAAKLAGGSIANGQILVFETNDDLSAATLSLDVLRNTGGQDIPFDILGAGSGQILEFGCSPNPVQDVHTTYFSVKATSAVDEIRVYIYDFSGQLMYDSGWGPNDLAWHLENDAGDVLANGVYYYRMEVLFVGADKPVVTGIGRVAVYR